MTLTTLARRAILAWSNWRSRRAMQKAVPSLAELNRQYEAHRRNHKRGSARIVKARINAVCAALRGPVKG